jgi:hypothetical protein
MPKLTLLALLLAILGLWQSRLVEAIAAPETLFDIVRSIAKRAVDDGSATLASDPCSRAFLTLSDASCKFQLQMP